MTDFDDAIAQQFSDLQSFAGRNVTYKRGVDSVTLTSVPGTSRYDEDNGNGMIIQHVVHDEMFAAADLILDDELVEPKEGDRIEITENGTTKTYKVLPVGDEPAWRYQDEARQRIRAHTKLTDES